MTSPLAADLGSAVQALAADSIDAPTFSECFAACTVYAVRLPGRPTLAAFEGAAAAPVFSSLGALARWCVATAAPGQPLEGVDWFGVSGADLMTCWPAGCDLVIDPGSAHPLRFPADRMPMADGNALRSSQER